MLLEGVMGEGGFKEPPHTYWILKIKEIKRFKLKCEQQTLGWDIPCRNVTFTMKTHSKDRLNTPPNLPKTLGLPINYRIQKSYQASNFSKHTVFLSKPFKLQRILQCPEKA